MSKILITIIGSLLLFFAWPESGLTFLIFFAWVPLLYVEDRISNWKRFFGIAYLHMLIWNVATTWWIWNASPAGSLGAFFANSLLMCIPWLLFRITKRLAGRWIGYGSLIVYWLTFEYIHHNWDLTWPWLTLGNAFATKPGWVQWYEYTGTTGGSLWILLSNIFLYTIFSEYYRSGRSKTYFAGIISWIIIIITPFLLSFLARPSSDTSSIVNVVVVQPNVDPYLKFQQGEETRQLSNLIELSEKMIDDKTRLVVWPETAIPLQTDENSIHQNQFYLPLWQFLRRHPQINLLTGIEGYRIFEKKNSINSRELDSGNGFYEAYNSAAIFDSATYSIYHKSKLVPGVERLPGFLKFMDNLFEKFGGTTGGYAPQSERTILSASNHNIRIAPAICYESIYSDFMTGFMRNGANLICIITNDAWWGETPGHRQHLQYARLRAIETRKWIARSANTGISCFIDPAGNILDAQGWDTKSVIKRDIALSDKQTFFSKNGDMISSAMSGVTIALLVYILWLAFRNRRNRSKQHSL